VIREPRLGHPNRNRPLTPPHPHWHFPCPHLRYAHRYPPGTRQPRAEPQL